MSSVNSISVLICTFNRARLLEQTLTSACSRRRRPTTATSRSSSSITTHPTRRRDVVRRARSAGPFPVRYLVERQQGKSFALNSGLAIAHGDVIALTDDDVLPARDWLLRICANFRSADVVFVFGKVLPRWEVPPPPEMLTLRARDIWGPLALIDYGDEPVSYDSASFGKKRLPVGANLAIRRQAIEQVGGWRTDLGRVDNTLIAGEDRELCVRLYRAGLYSGVYDPTVVVKHLVPASRLTRALLSQVVLLARSNARPNGRHRLPGSRSDARAVSGGRAAIRLSGIPSAARPMAWTGRPAETRSRCSLKR